MEFKSITKSLIDIKKYRKVRKIKAGGYGVVYQVEDSQTKQQYAAKILLSLDITNEDAKKMIDREIGIMMSINNPTLIKIYGFSLVDLHDEPNATIIMELAKNNSLSEMLEKVRLSQAPVEYTDTIRQIILIGIARGMKYLHDRNIMHRDLSTHNILLDDNLYPIITDFGMAKYLENDNSKIQSIFGGKPEYMAPEVIRCEPYGRKSDVYSFAIIMYQVVTDSIPYPEYTNGRMKNFQLNDNVINKNYRPLFDKTIKKSFKELIERCWSNNPEKRPTFKEIYNKLVDLNDIKNEDSCVLDNVETDEIEYYIDTINGKNDPFEKLIENLEVTEKELTECKKQKNGLEELNVQLMNNLFLRNKSFELDYPSETFSDNYEKILDIKRKKKSLQNEFLITINIQNIEETDNRFENDKDINCVNFGDSVKSIGKSSFKGCTSLRKVFISSSVKSIGENSFEGCTSLKQITIPSSVKNIAKTAFNECQSLIKVVLPSSVNEAMPFAEIDDYEINNLIKHRASYTFKVTNKKTKKIFALIVINDIYYKDNLIDFLITVKISQLGLPGILPIKEYRFPLSPDEKDKIIKFEKKKINIKYFIIQDYMKNGNILDITKEYLSSKGKIHDKMNPTIRSKIIFGVACTMKQLHARNVFHRNLKNADILLDDNFEPKIGSFVISRFLSSPEKYYGIAGTPQYTAPEIYLDKETSDGYYGFPVDVYAYSIFLYFMFSTEYQLPNIKKLTAKIFASKICEGQRPLRPKSIPDNYWNLIQQCWSQDPNDRPTFAEITEILKNDSYAIEEFGMKTDLELLHEYQNRIDRY